MWDEDLFWERLDDDMDAMFERVFGPDEPDLTALEVTTQRLRDYFKLQDQLWCDIRQAVIPR